MSEKEAIHKLVASIENEQRYFDMSNFTKERGDGSRANCKTASCIAGHIEAVFPNTTRAIASHLGYDDSDVVHQALAAAVWERVTGQPCRFDFFARRNRKSLFEITQKEAISHIKGTSRSWPLLPR